MVSTSYAPSATTDSASPCCTHLPNISVLRYDPFVPVSQFQDVARFPDKDFCHSYREATSSWIPTTN